jgi:hypothetical protein
VVTLIAEFEPRSILVPELFDVGEGIRLTSARPPFLWGQDEPTLLQSDVERITGTDAELV